MSLADLIRGKSTLNKFANATVATVATPNPEERHPVATVATVAVANPANPITETLIKVGTSDVTTASPWWRFHYAHREPKEAMYFPAVHHAEALSGEPDAISAEPVVPTRRKAEGPLSTEEETKIRGWLTYIGETDEAMIAATLGQCVTDADARNYFLQLARNNNDNRRWLS